MTHGKRLSINQYRADLSTVFRLDFISCRRGMGISVSVYYYNLYIYTSKTKKYVGCSVIPAPTIYQIYVQKKEYKKDCIPSHFIALIGLPYLTESQQY